MCTSFSVLPARVHSLCHYLISSVRESEFLPVLKTLTEDEDADVRYFSGEALGSIKEMKG